MVKFDKPYEAILNCMNEAVYFIDLEMNILYSNPAAEVLTGFPIAETQGAKCHDIFCERSFRCKDLCPPKIAMREKKPVLHREAETRTKSGEVKNTEIAFSPFYDGTECVGSVIVIKDITDIKKAEEKIKEQNRFLTLIIDSLPNPFYVIDADDFTIKIANRAAARENMSGQATCYSHTHNSAEPCHESEHPCPLTEVKRTKKPVVLEHIHFGPEGLPRNCSVHGYPIFDDKNNVVQIIEYVEDITERKNAEEALLYFQKTVDSAADAIGMSTPEGRHYYQNEAFTRLFGLSVSEVDGVSGPPSTVYADEKVGVKVFDTIMKGGSFAGEVKMLDKDRNEKDIYLRAYSIKSKEGQVVGLVGTHTDITDRKRAEEKLRKSERQLLESQKVAHLGNWDLNLVSQELEWSNETYRLFDKSPVDFVPSFNEFARVVHPDDRATMETNFFKALESDTDPYHVAVRIINDSGREWVMEAFGVVRRDSSGKALRIFGTAQDITERKRAEIKIMESEKLIRNILDTVDEGFIVVDRDFRILLANNAYCSQVGGTGDEVVGRHCYEASHKSLRPCYEEGEDCAVRHVFETGESHSTTHRHLDAKGDILYVETRAFPIKDSSGCVTSAIETIQNITEKYLLEEERLKTQKLEAIGTLAGGIAHDFNNLLQGVFGYISMTKMTLDDKGRSLDMLEQAEKALHMSVNLTSQLLTFSKGGKPVKKKISLQSVIENSVRFALSGSSAASRIKLDAELWHVEVDEGQIGQVIQNIVLNADQAMPMGGTIVISARNILASKNGMPQLPEEGKYVEISIKDNGIGISEEYQSKIFDPYFTTKAKGSGLGLATCYSIIKNHGGVINVSSKVGKGTTFYVYLPAIEAEKEIPQPPELSPMVRKGKILLMDDEELIRNIAGDMISALDHEVESVEHGEAAIEKYKASIESGKPFDIVILDLTIRGGMGGRETIERLLAVNPKIKAVVSSGYSDDAVVSDYHNYGFSASLTKPYKLQELSDTLNKLLGR